MEICRVRLIWIFDLNNFMNKQEYVRKELEKKGFEELPHFSFNPNGKRLVFLSNCCIYPFTDKNIDTPTKTYYAPTGKSHLLNVTASVAIRLVGAGVPVIIHLPSGVESRVRELFGLHQNSDLMHFVTGDLYDESFANVLYEKIQSITKETSVSGLDLCLYDSYASGLEKPFLPMFEDLPQNAIVLAEKRIRFLYSMAMICYDLLLNRGQENLRLICPTALASKRPSAHLFTDTIHKAVSNVLLETLGYELPYYTGKDCSVVDVAPGIVDSGIYDFELTRKYTMEEAVLDGFPMDQKVSASRIENFPMMSVAHLSEIIFAYLTYQKKDSCLNHVVSKESLKLTLAGRDKSDLFDVLKNSFAQENGQMVLKKQLPEYCYVPGAVWGGLPPLKNGYIPVMLTPPGQYF